MSPPPTKSQTFPPRRIALPSSSTFVFSSSRNPRHDSVSPPAGIDHPPQTTMTSSIVLHRQQQPPSPLGIPTPSTARARAMLSDRQLMRHGAGAQDIRSNLVYARTPAGFIPFEATPSSPQLGAPPSYDPAHNPFFPPVVVLGGSTPSAASNPSSHMPLPTVDEHFATASPFSASAESTPPPVSSNRPPPSTHSSQSSSSTVVSTTDIAINTRTSGLSTRSRSSVHSEGSQSGLSLTELFAADWTTTAAASGSSTKRRERRAKENTDVADLKADFRLSRSHPERRHRSDHLGSDSDIKCKVQTPEYKPSTRHGGDKLKSYHKTILKPAKIVDASTMDHPTMWIPD